LQKQAKARALERAFVIEGIKLYLEAPQHLIKEVYITQNFYTRYIDENSDLREKLLSSAYEIVSDIVFERMADTKSPQGIISILNQMEWEPSYPFKASLPGGVIFYLILEDLSDPGNLGTIFRTAEAAGVTAIILNNGCADIFNPKTVRATMGSIFRVPFIYTDDLVRFISDLKKQNIKIYAACPEGAEAYDKCDYQNGTAFIIGSESHGLRAETQALATKNLTIPMAGAVESLNAAQAAAVLLFEASRQRRKCEERKTI
jgi:TrmH family RNA methyltransferase